VRTSPSQVNLSNFSTPNEACLELLPNCTSRHWFQCGSQPAVCGRKNDSCDPLTAAAENCSSNLLFCHSRCSNSCAGGGILLDLDGPNDERNNASSVTEGTFSITDLCSYMTRTLPECHGVIHQDTLQDSPSCLLLSMLQNFQSCRTLCACVLNLTVEDDCSSSSASIFHLATSRSFPALLLTVFWTALSFAFVRNARKLPTPLWLRTPN